MRKLHCIGGLEKAYKACVFGLQWPYSRLAILTCFVNLYMIDFGCLWQLSVVVPYFTFVLHFCDETLD